MFVKAQSRRALHYFGIMAEAFVIVLIALVLASPLPSWASALLVAGLSYFAFLRSWFIGHVELVRDEALQQQWLTDLTLRNALDGLAEQIETGVRPIQIDWRGATQAAADDIKLAQSDEAVLDKLGASRAFEVALFLGFALLGVVARVVLGFALAVGLASAFPRMLMG